MLLQISIGLFLLFLQLVGIGMAIYSIITTAFHGDFCTRSLVILSVLFSVVLPTYVAYTMGTMGTMSTTGSTMGTTDCSNLCCQ